MIESPSQVNWKRASKLETKFEVPVTTYTEEDLDSEIESDEEDKIRQMAHRATLKRRYF